MPSDGDEERTSGQKTFAVLGYMLCSSLMLLANKLAIHYLQTPLFFFFVSFISATNTSTIGAGYLTSELGNRTIAWLHDFDAAAKADPSAVRRPHTHTHTHTHAC